MTDITKDTLQKILDGICAKITNAKSDDYSDSEWYREVLWDDEYESFYEELESKKGMNTEDSLAIEAVQYPELHPFLREIIKGITKINNEYWNGPIDVDSEWSAGSFFAGRLALATKSEEDILIFAEHLATRDIDHEAQPFDFFGVWEIFAEFGYCEKTVPVLIALFSANSQHRGDHFTHKNVEEITAYLNQGDNLNRFLKELAKWYKDYNIWIEELFGFGLGNALGIEEDQYEEAEEVFTEIADEGRIPTKDDFAKLKEE